MGGDGRSGVVIAEHLEVVGLAADSDRGEEREEVSWTAYRRLTNLTRGMRAGRAGRRMQISFEYIGTVFRRHT